MKAKPEEFCFVIHYDTDLGGFYSVFSRIGEEDLLSYDKELSYLTPIGFYPLSDVENIFGFNISPVQARKILKDKGFIENLDLV